MLMLAGGDATVHFTNLSPSSANSLSSSLSSDAPSENSAAMSKMNATTVGVLDLMKEHKVPISRVCLLDPKAELELSPKDGEGEFDWFLFGVRSQPY